ncbi:death domain-associated protein [Halobacteriales archaeon QS_4_70_19]|nr:MAG: death domain-associated protein [Halobacteriales archaeon QS_4_70_19]
MGFGSYDESERENRQQSTDEDDGETVTAHEHVHDGEMTFDSGAGTDELLSKLGAVKDAREDDDEG